MRWDYELTHPAEKDLARLERSTRVRIFEALDRLMVELSFEAPNVSQVKKLKGTADEFRLRMGDYRLRFTRESCRAAGREAYRV